MIIFILKQNITAMLERMNTTDNELEKLWDYPARFNATVNRSKKIKEFLGDPAKIKEIEDMKNLLRRAENVR